MRTDGESEAVELAELRREKSRLVYIYEDKRMKIYQILAIITKCSVERIILDPALPSGLAIQEDSDWG